MKATIWITRENEDFWDALPNKGGWVNLVIQAIIREDKKKREYIEKFREEQYAKNEKNMVQNPQPKTES